MTHASVTKAERLAGGIWGLLVGDAVGVPYEFHPPEALPAASAIDLTPPPGFSRAHPAVPPGTWSDDGAHALCLLDALLDRKRFEAKALAGRLLAWYQHGYFAVDGIVFDVGIQTVSALRAIDSGVDPLLAGPRGVRDNGNGSLMRALPLALWHRGSDEELIRDAMEQSQVTHGHAQARVCCALYCLWARRLLTQVEDAWSDAVNALRTELAAGSEEQQALELQIRPDDEPHGTGTGYVVDTLRSARLALQNLDFAGVIRGAIALGHDTDTTACVAGGLAGVRAGVGAIPSAWLTALRGREIAEPLIERLLSWHGVSR